MCQCRASITSNFLLTWHRIFRSICDVAFGAVNQLTLSTTCSALSGPLCTRILSTQPKRINTSPRYGLRRKKLPAIKRFIMLTIKWEDISKALESRKPREGSIINIYAVCNWWGSQLCRLMTGKKMTDMVDGRPNAVKIVSDALLDKIRTYMTNYQSKSKTLKSLVKLPDDKYPTDAAKEAALRRMQEATKAEYKALGIEAATKKFREQVKEEFSKVTRSSASVREKDAAAAAAPAHPLSKRAAARAAVEVAATAAEEDDVEDDAYEAEDHDGDDDGYGNGREE
ncbi:hypothetical protein Agub_g9422, partial [Astrephomene gubernaculifera]